MSILCIADDMTGALEVGAIFAGFGFKSIVSTTPPTGIHPDVIVIDSETRHCTPVAAAERVARFIRACDATPELVYKKTDSTLRGNIQYELEALSHLFPNWRIGYVPAYPAQGRIVRDGLLYVHGTLLHDSVIAQDVLNPVRTSSVRELVGAELPCLIFDGDSDMDVQQAADTILADQTMRIVAGPAAIGGALARRLRPAARPVIARPCVQTCLVVNGSRTDRSESQLTYARQTGCLTDDGTGLWKCADLEFSGQQRPESVAAARAQHVLSLLRLQAADGVFLIGGDTAFAFVAALGSPPLHPLSEVLPGVAVSHILQSDFRSCLPEYDGDLILITKSGGFGEVDVICSVRRILNQDAA